MISKFKFRTFLDHAHKRIEFSDCIFSDGIYNRGYGGYYINDNENLISELALIAKDTGNYIISIYSFPVIKHKNTKCKQNHQILYNFNISSEHKLNSKYIINPENEDKHFIINVKP